MTSKATVPNHEGMLDDPSQESMIRWQAEGFRLLADLSADMLSSNISRSSFEATFKRLAIHLGCEVFTNFEVRGEQLHLSSSLGLPDEVREMLQVLSFGDQLCGLCAKEDRLLYVPATELEGHPQGKGLWTLGLRCYVAAPISSGGQLMGTLAFASMSRRDFSPTEIDFVRNVASLIAAFKAKCQSDTELRQAELRQSVALSAAKTVIWESDPTRHQFNFVGGAFEELLGFELDDWIQPGFWRSRVHPDDVDGATQYCQANTQLLRNHRFEYRMIKKDGHIIWIEDFVQVKSGDGTVESLQGALMDISERKQLEQELQQSQKMQAIGRLAGGIAHDFNNVLTVVSTYAELMLGRLSVDDANRGPINAIREASERAVGLTSQLLVFSRKSQSDPKPLDLNGILKDSEKLLRRVIGEDILLDTQFAPEIGHVRADRSQIEQAVLNLAINARDAMPDGGSLVLATQQIDVEVNTIELEGLLPGAYVELTVQDTGCGMDEETLDKCFEPFFSTKPVGAGTGLGLFVTYGAVKDMGGQVRAESKLGHGTKFTILIPLVAQEEVALPEVRNTPKLESQEGNVLLVEDEAAVRKVARIALEMCGYSVSEAESGQHALDLVSQSGCKFDLLITDLVMPGMNGETLASKMREQYPELSVLFISGYGSNDLLTRNNLGADALLLSKPFTANGLTEATKQAIRQSNQVAQKKQATSVE